MCRYDDPARTGVLDHFPEGGEKTRVYHIFKKALDQVGKGNAAMVVTVARGLCEKARPHASLFEEASAEVCFEDRCVAVIQSHDKEARAYADWLRAWLKLPKRDREQLKAKATIGKRQASNPKPTEKRYVLSRGVRMANTTQLSVLAGLGYGKETLSELGYEGGETLTFKRANELIFELRERDAQLEAVLREEEEGAPLEWIQPAARRGWPVIFVGVVGCDPNVACLIGRILGGLKLGQGYTVRPWCGMDEVWAGVKVVVALGGEVARGLGDVSVPVIAAPSLREILGRSYDEVFRARAWAALKQVRDHLEFKTIPQADEVASGQGGR